MTDRLLSLAEVYRLNGHVDAVERRAVATCKFRSQLLTLTPVQMKAGETLEPATATCAECWDRRTQ